MQLGSGTNQYPSMKDIEEGIIFTMGFIIRASRDSQRVVSCFVLVSLGGYRP